MQTTETGPQPTAFESDLAADADRSRSEAEIENLRRKGGVFVDAVRATGTAMVLTDPKLPGNPIVFANQSFLDLSGYELDEVLGQQPYFMNGPETDLHDATEFREALEHDRDAILETVQYRKDGSRFVAALFVSAFKDEEGRTLHHFLSWLNVTSRVAAEADVAELRKIEAALQEREAQLRLLLAELQHRVRNTLAVVRSIARRTAENSTTVEDMLAHFQGRLDAFSRVQARLTRNPDVTVEFSFLVQDELVAYAARAGEKVRIAGPNVSLDPKSAERLSLAVHELTTNAVKRGALGNGGKVAINWKLRRKPDGELLHFSWKESGVEMAQAPSREGFGMDLLLRSLPYDLNAETEVEFGPHGLSFELRMPLPPPARNAG
jgi:two-component system CheB/CheR fusion protein